MNVSNQHLEPFSYIYIVKKMAGCLNHLKMPKNDKFWEFEPSFWGYKIVLVQNLKEE